VRGCFNLTSASRHAETPPSPNLSPRKMRGERGFKGACYELSECLEAATAPHYAFAAFSRSRASASAIGGLVQPTLLAKRSSSRAVI